MGKENSTYNKWIFCSNCKEGLGKHKIPKGVTVEEYCKDRVCPYCGCSVMKEKE